MKKTIAILGAFLVLIACDKQMTVPERNQEIKVDLTITRTDAFPGTKATFKNAWADNDVVFVFFQGVAAPKYLEMKYSGGSWTSTPKNELTAADLGASGTMTAVYLPYGSDAGVAADGTAFKFRKGGADLDYTGWFLQAASVAYTYDTELHGLLEMEAPSVSGKLIHFDISGFDSSDEYDFYQEFVKPLTVSGVASDGTVTMAEGAAGKAIPGFVDGTMMSFSGVLDAGVVGVSKDYQFSVNDKTSSVLYTRDAGSKKVSEAMYIGLGDLAGTKAALPGPLWTATEYVDLGIANEAGQRVMWAKMNLGATVEKGEGCYGNYYAWMKTKGYSLSGTFGAYTCDHTFDETNYALDPDGDPATAELKGLWRVPTLDEFKALSENATRTPGGTGILLGTSFTGKGSFAGASIFLPAAGNIYNSNTLEGSGRTGIYWSSTEETDDDKDNAYNLYFVYIYVSEDFSVDSFGYDGASVFSVGQSIRPVFSID